MLFDHYTHFTNTCGIRCLVFTSNFGVSLLGLRMYLEKKSSLSFAKDRMLSGFPAIIFTTTENVGKVSRTKYLNLWAMV